MNHSLWYREPAIHWAEHALPIGNGRLGGMIFGGVARDRIQFNEETLFTGRPVTVEGSPYQELSTIRKLLAQKNYKAAQEHTENVYLKPASYGDESDFGMYQNFGDIFVDVMHPEGTTADYRRELNLDDAVVSVSYTCSGHHYLREYLSSYPDQVLAVRYRCSKPGSVTLHIKLAGAHEEDKITVAPSLSELILSGQLSNLSYEAVLKVLPQGGRLEHDHGTIMVHGADEVILLMSASTDYDVNEESYRGKDFQAFNRLVLEQASRKSFGELKQSHVADYQALFQRVELMLDGPERHPLPTDERLLRYRNGESDVGLETLLFQYGRYLLIASSRPGCLPANLQGIWNDSNNPMWGSMFCYNINLNMNYWHAQSTNLAECHRPLVEFIDRLRPSGRRSAAVYFNAKGWFAAKKSDIWGFTQPYAAAVNGLFIGGGGWLCEDVWEAYSYRQDLDYLARTAYPIMKESAEFYLDYLTENKEEFLVSSPSTSPENSFWVEGQKCTVSDGSEIDHRIIESLFRHCIKACELLGTDDGFKKSLEHALSRLAPVQLGRYGQIQEWYQDWDNPADTHRHVSHLFGLYPGQLFSPEKTPEVSKGAEVVLTCRGTKE
ncbi:glycoside hydrolase family 95 protein [Paenibacillus sp. CC-CFT747]|nr:glycoside hydrolase family 95 protein [Paenibacillus sp. CC-CFT747]